MEIRIGSVFRKKHIRGIVSLSNGWILLKTEDGKSLADFRVRVILSTAPVRSMIPKHAHFVIDLYGKLCQDPQGGLATLDAICEIWRTRDIPATLVAFDAKTRHLCGYPLEYILYAMNWILDQEDINFNGRPAAKQDALDAIVRPHRVVPSGRLGSQLAIAVLCDVGRGTHPVEALLKANLDIIPRKKF